MLHSLSFVEDPTRILRAIRFERRFDFQIGGQTMRLIKNALNLKLFSKLSGTRVMHELQLIMTEDDPSGLPACACRSWASWKRFIPCFLWTGSGSRS